MDLLLRRIKKGSLTIEAAAVMPLILFVLFGVLYLCFYVHNRAWLTAAAYEAALSGSMEGIKEDGKVLETAEMKSKELGSTGFFGAENITAETTVSGKKVQVVYDLDAAAGFFGFDWHLHVKGESKIICPVKKIRLWKSAAETLQVWGG